LRTLLAIVALLCLASNLLADPLGPPLTAAEAARYVREHPELAAADVLRLQEIERAVPVVRGARLVVVATDDGVLRAYWDPEPVMAIDVAGELRYMIRLPEATAQMQRPPPAFGGYVVAAGLGLLVGAVGVVIAAALIN
jgi:hypothetical protein